MKIKTIDHSRDEQKYKAVIYDFSDEPNSGEIMWYFHGANNITKKDKYPMCFHIVEDYEDTNYEITTTRNMITLELMGEKKPKAIIVPSFGSIWMLSIYEKDLNNKVLLDDNFKQLMLRIESENNLVPIMGKRLGMGHSMGGWNLMVLASQPITRDMWSRCFYSCPMWPVQSWKSALPADFAIVDSTNAIILAEWNLKEKAYQDSYINSYGYKLIKDIPSKNLVWSSMGDIFKFWISAAEVAQICADYDLDNFMFFKGEGGHNHYAPAAASVFLTASETNAPILEALMKHAGVGEDDPAN